MFISAYVKNMIDVSQSPSTSMFHYLCDVVFQSISHEQMESVLDSHVSETSDTEFEKKISFEDFLNVEANERMMEMVDVAREHLLRLCVAALGHKIYKSHVPVIALSFSTLWFTRFLINSVS